MNLIYIDESGNTGNNLVDPEQPMLLMGALIVPEATWLKLEPFIESHKSLPLQLCDLISFWCRRMEEEKLGRKTTDGDRKAFPIVQSMIYQGTGAWDVVEWLVKEMQKQK